MLKCVFYKNDGSFSGFRISGHAGYETENGDVVCAAVSSATMLVCNTITDYFKVKADVEVLENQITLLLKEKNKSAEQLLESFYTHIEMIAQDYKKVKIEIKSGGKEND
ncbi:MAG: ribosomal-processing cysteine protease Prp [Oscillospiraceae bacterium]|nr:ribosomal-processing cysteine protease Prp [Oscillospiraceae bacterium]